MIAPLLACILLLTFVPLPQTATPVGQMVLTGTAGNHPIAGRDTVATPASEFVLDPRNGEWRRFSPSFIRIRFLNTSMDLVPEGSFLHLDDAPRSFAWNNSTRTLEAYLTEGLADGVHSVEASLRHGDLSNSELSWTFGVDTQVPTLILDPVPLSTLNQTLEIRGHVVDSGLVGLTVQGRNVPLADGNFTTVIRLWPGLNDVLVEAEDLAGNLGRTTRVVLLEIPAYAGPMAHRVLETHSFAVDLPEGWAAQDDIRLPSGNRADLIALAPPEAGLETSLIIASDRTTNLYSDARALEWMMLVLAGVSASGQLRQVVATPRLVTDPPGTVAVQSTFLRETASMHVVFMQITMVWSDPLRTQWMLMASADSQRAVEMWPALDASMASFRVLDQGIGRSENPDPAFFVPTLVVVGAIAVLSAIAFMTLLPTYTAWRKAKREGRWRPPRNWRL